MAVCGKCAVRTCDTSVLLCRKRGSMGNKKIGKDDRTGVIYYSGNLPAEVEGRLAPNVRKQHQLWDKMIKREVQLYPQQILPLLKEIFQKDYDADVKIELLSTEYAVPGMKEDEGEEKELHSIFTDLTIRINGKDVYHIECQMDEDREMVLRVIEYDLHIALGHGIKRNARGELMMEFPKSMILYLDHTKNTPDFEMCRLKFADGITYEYRVPVLKVQNYTPEDIREKNLRILIPFLPIRFRYPILKGKKKNREKAKKDLTALLSECMIIINQELENNKITEREMKDVAKLTKNACRYLYGEIPEVMKEVQEIMDPLLKMDWEIIEEQKEKLEEARRMIEEQKRELEDGSRTIERQKRELEDGSRTIERQKRELEDGSRTIERQKRELEDGSRTIERQREEREQIVQELISVLRMQEKSNLEIQQMLEAVFALSPADAEAKLDGRTNVNKQKI